MHAGSETKSAEQPKITWLKHRSPNWSQVPVFSELHLLTNFTSVSQATDESGTRLYYDRVPFSSLACLVSLYLQ